MRIILNRNRADLTSLVLLFFLMVILSVISLLIESLMILAAVIVSSYSLLLFILARKYRRLSAFLVFVAGCGLFVFGRFFSYFFTDKSINELHFFADLHLDYLQFASYAWTLVFMLYFIALGYSIVEGSKEASLKDEGDIYRDSMAISPALAFVIISPLVLYCSIYLVDLVGDVLRYGYVYIYENMNAEQYSSNANYFPYLLVAFAVLFPYVRGRSYRIGFVIFLILYSVLSGLAGIRGAFLSGAVLATYLAFPNANTGKVVAFLCCIGVLGVFLSLSFARSFDASFGEFLYSQGGSFFTLYYAKEFIEGDFLAVPFFQNLIPFVSLVASLLSDMGSWEVSYARYVAYLLDPAMYHSGFGIGWSVFADLLIIGLFNPFVVAFICLVFGILWKVIYIFAERNEVACSLNIVLMYFAFMLPRSGLNSLIPLSVICIICALFLLYTLRAARRLG